MKYLLIVLLAFVNSSCQSNVKNENKMNSIPLKKEDSIKIEGTIGIVTTSESYQFGEGINVWDKEKQLIEVLSIEEEYQILALKCLSKEEDFYKVQLPSNKIGYIKKSQKGIEFQTWEEHILSLFSVGFRENENPIKVSPHSESESVKYDSDEFYHPSKINGEWLQIKWGEESNWEYGWIRWRDKDKLLIELFYFA